MVDSVHCMNQMCFIYTSMPGVCFIFAFLVFFTESSMQNIAPPPPYFALIIIDSVPFSINFIFLSNVMKKLSFLYFLWLTLPNKMLGL